MPREQITFNRPGSGISDAKVSVETPRRNVHVAWNRYPTGWAQIGIDVTLAELRGMLAAAEDEAKAEARKLESAGELDFEQWQYRVVSDVLDRAELNATITTLRRARDAAYGKDA